MNSLSTYKKLGFIFQNKPVMGFKLVYVVYVVNWYGSICIIIVPCYVLNKHYL